MNSIEGGDVDGAGGRSIYGKTFEDENFKLSHRRVGLLSMVNDGEKDSNGSKFFITLWRLTHLDTQNVVFGTVLEGMKIVRAMEKNPGDPPRQECKIINSGEIPLDKPYLDKTYMLD